MNEWIRELKFDVGVRVRIVIIRLGFNSGLALELGFSGVLR